MRSCSERSSGDAIAAETYPAADAANRAFAMPTTASGVKPNFVCGSSSGADAPNMFFLTTPFIRGSSSRGAGRLCVGTSGVSSSRALQSGAGARSSVRDVGGDDAGDEVFGAEEQRWADRYGLLFLLIVVSLILSAANTTWLKVVAIVLQGGVVLFAFLAARAGRHAWRLAIVLVPVGVIVGIAGRIGGGSQPAELVAAIVSVVLPAAAIVALARRIMKEPFVSGRSVLGLLSVYLLIGMTFAATYVTIAVASEEPFFAQAEHAEPVDFTYFSFVTLATVGYGDFTAANPMPRMLAAIEGLTGQLYLVTVVAVAVSRVRTRREPPPGG